MSSLSTKQHTLDLEMDFPFQDTEISRTKYQSLYLSPIYVPNEFNLVLSNNTIEITLRYDFEEPAFKIIPSRHIYITQGQNTKRVFQIKATYGGANFTVMLKRFQDIILTLNNLSKKSDSVSFKKSINLILSFLDKVINEIKKDKNALEIKLFS